MKAFCCFIIKHSVRSVNTNGAESALSQQAAGFFPHFAQKTGVPPSGVKTGRAGSLPRSGRSLRQSKHPPQKLFDIPILFLFLDGFQLFSARGQGNLHPAGRPRQSKRAGCLPAGRRAPPDRRTRLFSRCYCSVTKHYLDKTSRTEPAKAAGIPAGRFTVCIIPCGERWPRQPARRPARDAENKCTAHRTQSRGCPLPV